MNVFWTDEDHTLINDTRLRELRVSDIIDKCKS